jgi:hypothetical protein
MKNNRLVATNPEEHAKARLNEQILGQNKSAPARVFHYGQVIDSGDSKNANRLKIRIPLIDDGFYTDDNGIIKDKIGDDKLPWAIASQGRTVDTPENGTVVVVALFDTMNPLGGRMWITSVPELDSKELFDKSRLKDELSKEKWKNAEKAIGINFNSSPEVRDRDPIDSKSRKINYSVGIRGKDKNKLLFEKAKTTLIQNEGSQLNESKVELTEKMLLTGKEFEIIANSSVTKHTPIFAKPMFEYLGQLEAVLDSTLLILSTIPSLWLGVIPNVANPGMAAVMGQWVGVKLKLQSIKVKGVGHSRFITIT